MFFKGVVVVVSVLATCWIAYGMYDEFSYWGKKFEKSQATKESKEEKKKQP